MPHSFGAQGTHGAGIPNLGRIGGSAGSKLSIIEGFTLESGAAGPIAEAWVSQPASGTIDPLVFQPLCEPACWVCLVFEHGEVERSSALQILL